MIYTVCAVRDRAVDGFGTPIFVASLGAAIRSFSDEINRSDSVLHAHPEDYDLYHIANYDDSLGAFECFAPRSIAVGKSSVLPSSS